MRRWWPPSWRRERQSSDSHKSTLVSVDDNNSSKLLVLSDDQLLISRKILDGLGRDNEIEIISIEPHSEDKGIVHIRQSETWDCGKF